MIELVQQFFTYTVSASDSSLTVAKKKQRMAEFRECFKHNAALPFVSKLHLFLEKPEDEAYVRDLLKDHEHKLIFIHIGYQAKYSNLIEYIQNSIPDNTIVCISNGDIMLDPVMPIDLIDRHVHDTHMFGLTRHEYNGSNMINHVCNPRDCHLIYNYLGSHDTFMMRTPILKTINLETINFKQNIYGAEAVFQKALRDVGYTIKNACWQIRVFHNHKGSVYFEAYKNIGNGYLCWLDPVRIE